MHLKGISKKKTPKKRGGGFSFIFFLLACFKNPKNSKLNKVLLSAFGTKRHANFKIFKMQSKTLLMNKKIP
ncbi:hypothetical protein BB414_06900 [Helicobacter pylori]|nr:hypothetical protein BB414_06900 [Helicobacter pylori]